MKRITLTDETVRRLLAYARVETPGAMLPWPDVVAAIDAAEDIPDAPPPAPTFGPWVAHNGGPRPDNVAPDATVQVHLDGVPFPRVEPLRASEVKVATQGKNGDPDRIERDWSMVIRYRVQRAPVREVREVTLHVMRERGKVLAPTWPAFCIATIPYIDGVPQWSEAKLRGLE